MKPNDIVLAAYYKERFYTRKIFYYVFKLLKKRDNNSWYLICNDDFEGENSWNPETTMVVLPSTSIYLLKKHYPNLRIFK